MSTPSELQASYDTVAEEYTARISDELDGKPFDRELLDRFADTMRDRGRIYDVGCGPGHVARYLHERGLDVTGIDLSPRMIEAARRCHPDVRFEQGDLTALAAPDASAIGIVAFYSIIHVARDQLVPALYELGRVLVPGGALLLAFHIGAQTVHLDQWWGHQVSADFHFFEPSDMAAALTHAGFTVDTVAERDPYPGVEHPSRRAYVWAVRCPPRPRRAS